MTRSFRDPILPVQMIKDYGFTPKMICLIMLIPLSTNMLLLFITGWITRTLGYKNILLLGLVMTNISLVLLPPMSFLPKYHIFIL